MSLPLCDGYYAHALRARQGTVLTFQNDDYLRMSVIFRRLVAIVLTLPVAVAIAVPVGFAGAYQFLAPEIPSAASLSEVRSQLPLEIYSRDHKLIAKIGEQRRIPVAYGDIPKLVVDAFLAAEDDRFFQHPGVDWQGLVRAAYSNFAARGVREGGGTITMQLARNTVLTSERTLRRKLKEVFLALSIERRFSKQEILSLYLNRIFLGQRAYGIGAGAEVYFSKPVAALTLPEAALLAGLPRSPSRDNPVASPERAAHRRAYVLRRMLETGAIGRAAHDAALAEPLPKGLHGPTIEVDAPYVAEMVRAEMLHQHGPGALTDGYVVTTTVDSRLQAAANAAAWRAILEYDRRHGYRGAAEQLDLATLDDATALAAAFKRHPPRGNLRPAVVTKVADRAVQLLTATGERQTLDWDGMAWASPYISDNETGAAPHSPRGVLRRGSVIYVETTAKGGLRLAQVPAVSGALVALDPSDGAIVALVGGFDFDASKFNRVTQAERQPGSAFKPFLYSAALEKGFTPATLVNDAPIVLQGATAEADEEWRPQNITRRFYGPTPMREGLVRSRNLVSIRLLRGIGVGYATQYIAGFGLPPAALPGNLTLALGTGQVTPLEMARGFAAFANGGYRVTPFFLGKVQDATGQTLFEAAPLLACPDCAGVALPNDGLPEAAGDVPAEAVTTIAPPVIRVPPERRAPRAISAANAFVMTDMLVDVVQRGTATRALTLGRNDIAGKTGTTSDRRDTWFVGYNADLAAAAWIGFDQERSLGENEEGGKTALPMWIYFMEEALRDRPLHRLPEPPGVVRMWVSRANGQPARAGVPGAVFEAFLEQFAPRTGSIDYSEEVGAETVEPASGDETLF